LNKIKPKQNWNKKKHILEDEFIKKTNHYLKLNNLITTKLPQIDMTENLNVFNKCRSSQNGTPAVGIQRREIPVIPAYRSITKIQTPNKTIEISDQASIQIEFSNKNLSNKNLPNKNLSNKNLPNKNQSNKNLLNKDLMLQHVETKLPPNQDSKLPTADYIKSKTKIPKQVTRSPVKTKFPTKNEPQSLQHSKIFLSSGPTPIKTKLQNNSQPTFPITTETISVQNKDTKIPRKKENTCGAHDSKTVSQDLKNVLHDSKTVPHHSKTVPQDSNNVTIRKRKPRTLKKEIRHSPIVTRAVVTRSKTKRGSDCPKPKKVNVNFKAIFPIGIIDIDRVILLFFDNLEQLLSIYNTSLYLREVLNDEYTFDLLKQKWGLDCCSKFMDVLALNKELEYAQPVYRRLYNREIYYFDVGDRVNTQIRKSYYGKEISLKNYVVVQAKARSVTLKEVDLFGNVLSEKCKTATLSDTRTWRMLPKAKIIHHDIGTNMNVVPCVAAQKEKELHFGIFAAPNKKISSVNDLITQQ
jgi:hypothetical protein